VTLVLFGTSALLFQQPATTLADQSRSASTAALSPISRRQARDRYRSVVSCSGIVLPMLAAAMHPPGLVRSGPCSGRPGIGFNGRSFRIYKFRTMIIMENGDIVQQAQRATSG
jgi:lipopolysaccharide/colanic/teichoic acid biosynthesis glycosyltransferase